MTAERPARLVSWWVRLYTRGLPEHVASRRAHEIDADLHDHIAFARQHGTGGRRVAAQILSRMVRGVVADVTWRRSQIRKQHRRRWVREQTGRTSMNRTAATGVTVVVVAVVLGLAFVMSGLLFAPARTGPHPVAIIVWLVFGGGVATVGRMVPRAAVLGAAGLLAIVALVDLAFPVLNVLGSPDFGWISASEYTWLAIAILAANGFAPVRTGRRQAHPEADPDPST